MKALKSNLAMAVLADANAIGQLRVYLASKNRRIGPTAASGMLIEVQFQGRSIKARPTVVPKAA